MVNSESNESGFLTYGDLVSGFSTAFTEIEILDTGKVNIFARGKRYGRYWMLKGLREELRSSTTHVQQLLKEFEIHSGLNHQHIVRAVSMEEVPGVGPCIVMEWIEGETLAQNLRSGMPDMSARKRILREIAEAVDYMHSAGIVHRDLKPDNVMIRRAGGEAVIIDMGLADNDSYAVLKQPAGTTGYISPEQIERGGTDTADDIYSLGVIMTDMGLYYGRLSERCKGKLSGRPQSVSKLIAAMDRHDRRPKLFAVAICGLLMAIMATVGFTEIKSMISNRDSEVAFLTDSLNNVTERLHTTQASFHQLHQKGEVIDSIKAQGRQIVLEILDRYDREVFAKMNENNSNGYPEAQQKLIGELNNAVSDYCDSLANPILTDVDKASITTELRAFYPITLNDYIEKWLKKIYPTL